MDKKENKYQIAEDIKLIAEKLIKEYDDLRHIDTDKLVVCRLKKHIKGDDVLGRCVLLSERTKFLTDKAFMLEFPIIFDSLNDTQKKIVVRHELLHISPEGDKLMPHQIGEFFTIVNEFGLQWLDTYKDIEKRINNLEEAERLEKAAHKLQKQKEKLQEAQEVD